MLQFEPRKGRAMPQPFFDFIKKIKNRHRRKLLLVADLFLISVCYLITWLMLAGRISFSVYAPTLLVSWLVFTVIFIISFVYFKMYDSLWRYAEAQEFMNCVFANIAASGLFGVVTWIFLRPPLFALRVPIPVYVLSAMLAGMSTLFFRMAYRANRTTKIGKKLSNKVKKVMVVGAGETGNAIIQDINREVFKRYEIVCAVDDDKEKHNRSIQRVKVEGTTKDIPKLVERHGIEIIILAIPNATDEKRRQITTICAGTKCQLKKVPDLSSYVMETNSIVSQIRDVSVEDVLGRGEIDITPKRGAVYLKDKTVLVTGAGGTVGAELCRQIAMQKPGMLIMLDICENGLYNIQQELLRNKNICPLRAEIASVRDEAKLEKIFNKYKPQIVFHAAAHKHVPLMENAPEEAVKNNIFGTLNAARCAISNAAERFVMISTDKAVNPTNVMSASKRVCEMIIQCMNGESATEFVAVRFGNVLGSNGSVIPLFKEQIAAGGPVTVTHPDIIRFFMTISEAVSLVLTAGRMAKGGEIFVLDMGEQVKIQELAETLIRLSGYEPGVDIEIKHIGLRPGEKLYEELLTDEEGLKKTSNKKIYIGRQIDVSKKNLLAVLDQLKLFATRNESEKLINALIDFVPGYRVNTG